MFSPEADLDGRVLASLSGAPPVEDLGGQPALASGNATLFQDPARATPDLLAMLRANKRAAVDFPDLVPGSVTLGRALIGERSVFVVRSEEGAWPASPAEWTPGILNRIDIAGASVYEMAVNLGQIGPRATIIRRTVDEAKARPSQPLLVDLGERDGDLGLERGDRARLDYTVLARLGYQLVVPYDLELALGAKALADLQKAFPGIRFIASNVKAKDAALFENHHIVEVGGAKIALDYFVPSGRDDASDLGLSYNMVHEVLIPFVGELSLSVAADVLVYKGKLPETGKLGTNAILKVGITYNRLWKPRHQPFF